MHVSHICQQCTYYALTTFLLGCWHWNLVALEPPPQKKVVPKYWGGDPHPPPPRSGTQVVGGGGGWLKIEKFVGGSFRLAN